MLRQAEVADFERWKKLLAELQRIEDGEEPGAKGYWLCMDTLRLVLKVGRIAYLSMGVSAPVTSNTAIQNAAWH